jgi:serine/threonine protein kinase
VEDTQGKEPDSILKRIKDPERVDRYLAEVAALSRLHHPNIIKMVDLPKVIGGPDSRALYYVMPYAKEGDLERNVAWFRDSLDLTLSLGISLAAALNAAHSANVIHRDVKPANILFFDRSPSAVLSDFGICLLMDAPRNTPDGRIVGPRGFTAPELETGGQVDVKPSADLYSLGKVLYYAISGGVVIPRESHRDGDHERVFRQGSRSEMFGRLLDQLICLDSSRLQTATEVLDRLRDIVEFESKVRLPITERANSILDEMAHAESEFISTEQFNAEVRKRQAEEYARFITIWADWAEKYLSAAIKTINALPGIKARYNSAPWANGLPFFGQCLKCAPRINPVRYTRLQSAT